MLFFDHYYFVLMLFWLTIPLLPTPTHFLPKHKLEYSGHCDLFIQGSAWASNALLFSTRSFPMALKEQV